MRLRIQTGLVLFAVVTATITEAQNTSLPQQPRQRQQLHGNTAGTKSSAALSQQSVTPPPEVPQVAASLLDLPARPAQVQLDEGKLSVKAENSQLSEILHNISAKTGMTVDGLSRDQRIFGTYGPAGAREVLSALLDGLGYNVMMVGTLDNGAPRTLTLTARTGGSATTGNRSMPVARQNNGEDDDDSVPDQQDNPLPPRPEPNPPDANQSSPDQQQQQQQQPANPGQPGQVKTPQQMLQELQQMRQQQLQQQQQQVAPQ
jgi:hypothetical protein